MDNQTIAGLMRELAHHRRSEVYACKALNKSADIIEHVEFPITLQNSRKLLNIQGFGQRSLKRVNEILETGTLEELSKYERTPKTFDFSTITGVGPTAKESIIKMGYTTLEELKDAHKRGDIELNKAQAFGLSYYEDLHERIPREEVCSVGHEIIQVIHEIQSDLLVEIVGSYRRGEVSSGDIDIIMSSPSYENVDGTDPHLLREVYDKLNDEEILYEKLSLGRVKFMGAYKGAFDNRGEGTIMRKIDIRLVPYSSFPTALMHSTGSKEFNVLMRSRALSFGLSLSEYGLQDIKTKEYIDVSSEEDIFEELMVLYISPEDRTRDVELVRV